MNIFLFDIDGTIADIEHRLHLIERQDGKKKDWDTFFKSAVHDLPIYPVLNIAKSLVSSSHLIGYITARPLWTKTITEAWLKSYGLPTNNLYMRPDNNYAPDHQVKKILLDTIRAHKFNPIAVFEDRDNNIDMFLKEGLVVLHVKTSSPETT